MAMQRGAPRLDEQAMETDPLNEFRKWFEEARQTGVDQPEAMTLATATAAGVPSARVVLLKDVDAEGFVFFTNYRSRKAGELAANSRAALVVYWPGLKRQVRIEGTVERISPAESDAYFRTRPRESQLGAHASPQSETIGDRAELERRFREAEARFDGKVIPRPPHWGGYRVKPVSVEFWQSGFARLHDRIIYERNSDGSWRKGRLAP